MRKNHIGLPYVVARIAQDHLVLLVSGKSFDMFVLDINEVDCHQEGVCRGLIYDAPPSRLISRNSFKWIFDHCSRNCHAPNA